MQTGRAVTAPAALTDSLLGATERAALSAIFAERVRFDEPLAPHTSWKIGGPADAFALVENTAELAALMRYVFKRKLPWFVLGSGSNLLIGDGGIRGVVIRLGGEFARIEFLESAPGEVLARAGASNLSLVTLLVPVSALALGAAVLGETVSVAAICGLALIICGLAINDGRVLRLLAPRPKPRVEVIGPAPRARRRG